ncbi:hypothetical protein [Sphingomonas phyllosphaerae]|uniref:hypothetical protein n=1 Tax=Sphingomonas phyllosphaerae TaxID=257003 RepID=UPI002FF966C7
MRVDQNMVAAGRMAAAVPPVDGAVADGRSFADWLASAGPDDGLTDDAERPFSNGTMRAAAQRFDAEGLLETGTVPAAGGANVEVLETADAVQVAPPPAVAPAVATVAALAIYAALPSSPIPSATVREDHAAATLPTMPVTSATHSVPVARTGMATPMVTAQPLRFAAIASEPAATVRRTREPATPAVQVTLTEAENGVTVAIAGDVAREEEAGVQQAVRRLLARHGLTLGDMRFVRRVGGGRQLGER